jgi:K+-sensing histidine kinase KdpD
MSIYFNSERIVINGVIGPLARERFTGERRKIFKKYFITDDEVEALQGVLKSIDSYLEMSSQKQVKDSVAFLHDIRTSVGIVYSWCQELISKQKGGSFEEKLALADTTTLSLLKSINLLSDQLNLIDIIANPNAITYGKRYKSQIHGLILKMTRLFEPRASKRGNKIVLRGTTHAEGALFQSFQYVPLVLLDNAIKYSYPGRDIVVTISEAAKDLMVTVNSYGKLVPEEYRTSIFDKYVRGPNIVTENPHGMGMGLYLARLIARAHGSDIQYKAIQDTGEIGSNVFTVTIKKVP